MSKKKKPSASAPALPAASKPPASQKPPGILELLLVKELLPIVCLLIAILWYASFKVSLMHYNPGYSPEVDKGMFWSETAYQYRYAKLFAENDPHIWETLKKDVKLQYPDGVDTWKDYTTFMEPFDGLVYRFAIPKTIPFHDFLIWFVALFSSLTAFMIYGVCRALWKTRTMAFIAALSWMLMPASFMRQVSAIYLKEDFSLLFVASFILLFIISLGDRQLRFPIAGAIALFIALASWHLSQFFFLMLMGCVGGLFIFRSEWEKHWTRNILIYLASALAAACFLPVLWHRAFIISQGMLISYALLASVFLKQRLEKTKPARWWVRMGLLGGFFMVLALSNLPFAAHFKEYAHVFELFIYKVKYLNVMPGDPGLLPFEARVFWAGDFVGASMEKFIGAFKWFSPFALLVPFCFAVGLLRRKLTVQEQLLGLVFLGSLFIYWLVDRLSIFFAPMLAVDLCMLPAIARRLLPRNTQQSKNRAAGGAWKIDPLLGAVYAIMAVVMLVTIVGVTRMRPVIDVIATDKTELFDWLRANTAPEDPILCNFPDGPMLLLYTGRPVILNSQYENSFIRKRTQEFNAAYFGSEDRLYSFCRKYGARWLCIRSASAVEVAPGSDRFGAAFIGPLPVDCAAAKIQFAPKSMAHFAPGFDNPQYRVMQVLAPGEHPSIHWKRGYNPRFNPALFTKEGDFYVRTDKALERIGAADKLLREAEPLFAQMINTVRSGVPGKARSLADLAREKLAKAASYDPEDYMIYSDGAILEAEAGNMQGAVDRAAQALSVAPSDQGSQRMFFDFASRLQAWEMVGLAGKKLLENPDNADNRPFLMQQVALAALSRQEYDPAARYADSAITGLSITTADTAVCNRPLLYYILAAVAVARGDLTTAQQDLALCGKYGPDPEVQKKVQALIQAQNGKTGGSENSRH